MSAESLNWILQSMKANFMYDALQILWFCPENEKYYEIFREGYNQACAESLNYDFPVIYPRGFTQAICPLEQLPPSISESGELMQPPFRMTNIYLNSLNKYGFYDGLSLELNSAQAYIGLIHFSSYRSNHFSHPVRFLINNFKAVVENWIQQHILYNKLLHHPLYFISKEKSSLEVELIKGHQANIKSELVLKIMQMLNIDNKLTIIDDKNIYAASIIHLPNGNNMLEIIPAKIPKNLSKKELMVLSWLVLGKTDKEISSLLFLAERTINSHITAILRKLEVNNRVEAAVYAISHDLIRINPNTMHNLMVI